MNEIKNTCILLPLLIKETNAMASNAMATVTGVITGHDKYISAVQDDSSPSGYAIKLSDDYLDGRTKYVYMVSCLKIFYASVWINLKSL